MSEITLIIADAEPQILKGLCNKVPWEKIGARVAATAINV